MNIQSRLTKLENNRPAVEERNEIECEHPRSMFRLYRVHAPAGYRHDDLITKGHCDSCGFDDYMLAFNDMTVDQEVRRFELKYASAFYEARSYDLELIAAGAMDFVAWPPPLEVMSQYQHTGN